MGYTTCVDGNPTPGKCSTGVVWSPTILACTTPPQSKRPECEAAVVREFTCPKTRLRFGNHDQLAHPEDCGKFYVCFKNGTFNKASCDKPMAFDEATGRANQRRRCPAARTSTRKKNNCT